MLLSGNGAKISAFVQGAVTNSKTKGFTDHNKKWLKPKAPVASPVEPVEKLMDDSDTDDGAVIPQSLEQLCQVLLPVQE